MAKVYWRNGWAYARAQVKGVERRKALGTHIATEAEVRFRAWISEIESERQSKWTGKETSFRDAVRVFTDDHLPTLARNSQARYLTSLIVLSPQFEGTTLQQISKADLTKFVSDRRRSGVADSTIRRDLACLSSVFTVAGDYELVDVNPVLPFMRAKRRTKQLVEADKRTRYLSHDEELRLLIHAKSRSDELSPDRPRWIERRMILAAIALYVDTGFRAQELLAMEWPWVDLPNNQIVIPAAITKSGRSRTVPLLERAANILAQIPRHPKSPYVLWRCGGGKRFSDLNKTIQRLGREVGISDVHVHDLRRTCGCRLLQDHKLSYGEVRDWLGHASVTLTEASYAFLKVENLHEAIGRRQVENEAKLHLGRLFVSGDHRTPAGTAKLQPFDTACKNA